MICRKTYRKYLLVLLGISLLVLGVYDYFRERALIPDSYTQTEGGAGPETPGFPAPFSAAHPSPLTTVETEAVTGFPIGIWG